MIAQTITTCNEKGKCLQMASALGINQFAEFILLTTHCLKKESFMCKSMQKP